MRRGCLMNCFNCIYPDCINDSPPTMKEIRIIESHDKYVKSLYLTDEQRKRREYDRMMWRTRYSKRAENQKSDEERRKATERTRKWRERQKAGSM